MVHQSFKDTVCLHFTSWTSNDGKSGWVCDEVTRRHYFTMRGDLPEVHRFFFEGNAVLVHAQFTIWEGWDIEEKEAYKLVCNYFEGKFQKVSLR